MKIHPYPPNYSLTINPVSHYRLLGDDEGLLTDGKPLTILPINPPIILLKNIGQRLVSPDLPAGFPFFHCCNNYAYGKIFLQSMLWLFQKHDTTRWELLDIHDHHHFLPNHTIDFMSATAGFFTNPLQTTVAFNNPTEFEEFLESYPASSFLIRKDYDHRFVVRRLLND